MNESLSFECQGRRCFVRPREATIPAAEIAPKVLGEATLLAAKHMRCIASHRVRLRNVVSLSTIAVGSFEMVGGHGLI